MANKQSVPRLRSVRFKSGGELRLVSAWDPATDRAHVERRIKRTLDQHVKAGCRVAGFAFIVWAPDGASTADTGSRNSSAIPDSLIPSFVAERLRTTAIRAAISDALDDAFGPPPDPAS